MSGARSGTWTQAKHDKHVVWGPRHGMCNKECTLAVTILGKKFFLILRSKLIEICLSSRPRCNNLWVELFVTRGGISLLLGNFLSHENKLRATLVLINYHSTDREFLPTHSSSISRQSQFQKNPRQPASPLSHPTEISQASAQALHPYSLFPWQVMISAIRRIPQTNTSDISLLQDGLIKWTNFPTEESLRVTHSLVDLASCNLWDVWLVT